MAARTIAWGSLIKQRGSPQKTCFFTQAGNPDLAVESSVRLGDQSLLDARRKAGQPLRQSAPQHKHIRGEDVDKDVQTRDQVLDHIVDRRSAAPLGLDGLLPGCLQDFPGVRQVRVAARAGLVAPEIRPPAAAR